ncbi:hypothetical protein AAD018_004375 [Aestuariibius insulae]|uniref:hypothetical protein n=1 Tax=Aestuariibius insulae TaxID=2058287 RepID=UPI00345EC4F3
MTSSGQGDGTGTPDRDLATGDLSSERAKELYQEMLDRMGAAYETGDFDAYCDAIEAPFTLATFEHEITMRTQDDLRVMFNAFRKRLDQVGVTQFVRSCIAAEFHGPEMIEGTHVSSCLRDGMYIEDPFPVTSILRRRGPHWKAASSQNALPDPSLFTQVMVEARQKICPEGRDPNGPGDRPET